MKKLIASIVSIVALLMISSCAYLELAGQYQSDTNKALVNDFIDAINQRDLGKLNSLVAADVVRHSQATPGVSVTNLEEFKDYLRADFAGIPDSIQRVELMISEGEYVSIRALYTGTHTGPIGDIPPSGKKVQLIFMAMLRIENNLIAEIWVEWDNMSILAQIGAIPTDE